MHNAMNIQVSQKLLRELPLTPIDAARLVLELAEELGEQAAGRPRGELLQLFRRVLRAGAAAVRQEENTVPFREAAAASLEARQRAGRRAATLADLRHFIARMLRVQGVAERPLRALSQEECRHLLQTAFGGSLHSYRKGRAILHSIFAYGMRRGWCAANPVSGIEVPAVQEKPIEPLTLPQVRRLERTAARPEFADMRLPLALMLYCGLRPAEAARLQPQRDIDRSGGCVLVRPQVSKTGGGRLIPLRAGARRISEARHNAPTLPPPLTNWRTRWRALRTAAGFTRWQADACRHTFASYHAAYFRNMQALQLEMGHRDATLLRSRYMVPVSPVAAAAFWKT